MGYPTPLVVRHDDGRIDEVYVCSDRSLGPFERYLVAQGLYLPVAQTAVDGVCGCGMTCRHVVLARLLTAEGEAEALPARAEHAFGRGRLRLATWYDARPWLSMTAMRIDAETFWVRASLSESSLPMWTESDALVDPGGACTRCTFGRPALARCLHARAAAALADGPSILGLMADGLALGSVDVRRRQERDGETVTLRPHVTSADAGDPLVVIVPTAEVLMMDSGRASIRVFCEGPEGLRMDRMVDRVRFVDWIGLGDPRCVLHRASDCDDAALIASIRSHLVLGGRTSA